MRNPATQNAQLGAQLRDVAEHMLLLSATPVNLKADDLFHQLNLIDPEFFADKTAFPRVLEANALLLAARSELLQSRPDTERVREHLEEARGHELLADNGQLAYLLANEVTDAALRKNDECIRIANRIERVNLLSHAVTRTRKRDVHELRVVRDPKTHFTPMSDVEREAYDLITSTIQDYAEEANIVEGFLLAGPQRQASSCLYAAVRAWQRSTKVSSREYFDDLNLSPDQVDDREAGPLRNRLGRNVLPRDELEALRANDTKYQTFHQVISGYLSENPGEKLVVFSYYPKTLEYLHERLAEDGLDSVTLHGSTGAGKDDVIDQFREGANVRVLLSSEVASEGVDLQFCRALINYDLPWNPMKVEQRIGRIDRIGQESPKVTVLNMGHQDTIDDRIYTLLMRRLGVFEKALGGLESVLGKQIKELTDKLFSQRLTPAKQGERIEQTAQAVDQVRQQEEELEGQASSMIAHADHVLERIQTASELSRRVTPEDIRTYVTDYLERFHKGYTFRQLKADEPEYTVQLPTDLAAKLVTFIERKKLHGQTRLGSGHEMQCRIATQLDTPSRRRETVTQFHPLVRFISEDLHDRNEGAYPLVSLALTHEAAPSASSGDTVVFVVQRWSFEGLKKEEQLQIRAMRLGDAEPLDAETSLNFLDRARVAVADWMAAKNQLVAGNVEAAVEVCRGTLKDDYDKARKDKELDNNDRVRLQLGSAQRHHDSKVAVQQELLDRYQADRPRRMIPAVEGKKRRIQESFEVRRNQLESRKGLRADWTNVCFGVARME